MAGPFSLVLSASELEIRSAIVFKPCAERTGSKDTAAGAAIVRSNSRELGIGDEDGGRLDPEELVGGAGEEEPAEVDCMPF